MIRSETMKLNVKKILAELERTNTSQAELAEKMGISRQLLNYHLRNTQGLQVRIVERFAKALKLDEKDLVV